MSRRVDRHIKTLYEKEQEELRAERFKKYGPIHRGDIFYFDKGFTTGVEQQGGRPGIIVSNDACNNSSDFLLVCYLTTQPKTDLPTHTTIMCEQPSTCLCEQVHTLSKEKMQRYYCTATPEEMAEIDKALITTLGIDLSNVVPEEYGTLLNQIKELEEIVADKEDVINNLQAELRQQLDHNSVLVDKIAELKETNIGVSIETTPEYIKVCAERDVYMKLYKDLLAGQK